MSNFKGLQEAEFCILCCVVLTLWGSYEPHFILKVTQTYRVYL